jgi:hypothetical protein
MKTQNIESNDTTKPIPLDCSAAFDQWREENSVGKVLAPEDIRRTTVYSAFVAGWEAASSARNKDHHAMMNGPRIAQSLPVEYIDALLAAASTEP